MDYTGRILIGLVLLGALAGCSSDVITASAPQPPVATSTPLPSTTAATTAATAPSATPMPEPTSEPTPTPVVRTVAERVDRVLAVAGFAPFNVDSQGRVTPSLFGTDKASQTAGFECYEAQLPEVIDLAALRERAAATGGYIELLPMESLGARKAVAHCLAADEYRATWISNQVWGWNTYGRDRSAHTELSPTDPCFEPMFDSPEEFVSTLVTAGYFPSPERGFIGPFDCRAAIGIPDSSVVVADAEPTPPSYPWTACNTFDSASRGFYRVVNIPADDPDGGLVAHVSPGVDADVTDVLAEGTAELQISGCQVLNDGALWWLVDDHGWVNAYYLEAVRGANPEWQPGLSDPLDVRQFAALVGLEAPDLDTLTASIAEALEGEAPLQASLLNFVALDAQGGTARVDVGGFGDDSVGGYRLELPLAFVRDETETETVGFRVTAVTARAFCTRGVSNGGRCV